MPLDTAHLSSPVPQAPDFGRPCPIRPSPDTLALMATRRSSSAQTLASPGPSDPELADLLRLAARVPDHGKMTPWRFILLMGEAKTVLVERLRALAGRQPNPAKAEAALAKMSAPPLGVVVVSSPRDGGKPVWEQQLSAGAVCMNLLTAAQAMGYGANWITDWYSYDAESRALLACGTGSRWPGRCSSARRARTRWSACAPDLDLLVSRLEL